MDERIDPDKYVCGSGDVLELNFWGIQNFKQRVTVDLESRAFIPKVGFFDIHGKTLTQVRKTLRDSVSRFYPRLSFDVTLAEPRSFLVQVVDDVAHPGSYPARAIDRVAAVISRAGGLGPNASQRRVEIRRRDGTTLRADLLLFAQTGDIHFNPYVLDGDVVLVPFEELAASISGAVNRPGRYELTSTKDLAELVELGGGLAPSATRLLPITVVRRSNEDHSQLSSIVFPEGGGLPAQALQKEDSVRIPSATELQQSVSVIGAVAGGAAPEAGQNRGSAPDEASATRRLPFVKGDTVRTLLERVNGVGPLADLTGSYLLRDGHSIPVDLYAMVMLRDFKSDRPVELGDTLVIPFKRRNVLVEGAVFAPGAYPFNPTFGVEQYLSLAGGRNRYALSLDEVKLVTPDGNMKDYAPGLQVDPGSSLVVPERNFTRSEIVQIILGGAGIILSGVAVVIAARR
ncbi:MAG TPA: polysaccharide biosynthesis/export family protein [Myxococcales bacterium]|nr:polysaccharide biosynthesis/export family protein [Myxococcales bacterium]